MPDFPIVISDQPAAVVSTFDPRLSGIAEFMETQRLVGADQIWTVASRAFAYPIVISKPVTVHILGWYNGSVVSGNVDVGIYDTNYSRIVSVGGVAQAGVSSPQSVRITDTLLTPGDYYFAMVLDNATGRAFYSSNPGLQFEAAYGGSQMNTAYPLPATWVPAVPTISLVPYIGAVCSGTVF